MEVCLGRSVVGGDNDRDGVGKVAGIRRTSFHEDSETLILLPVWGQRVKAY